MPFNPLDPRGSIASLLSNRFDPNMGGGGFGGGGAAVTWALGGGGGFGGRLRNASQCNARRRWSAECGTNGGYDPKPLTDSPSPMAATPMGNIGGQTQVPLWTPPPGRAERAAGSVTVPTSEPARWQQTNPEWAGTGGNSPGVTVTPGITPFNYASYFGQGPTSAADPDIGLPSYTSTADARAATRRGLAMRRPADMPFDPERRRRWMRHRP